METDLGVGRGLMLFCKMETFASFLSKRRGTGLSDGGVGHSSRSTEVRRFCMFKISEDFDTKVSILHLIRAPIQVEQTSQD